MSTPIHKNGEVRAQGGVDRPASVFSVPVVPMRPLYWLTHRALRLFGRLWLRLELVHAERVPSEGPVLILSTHTSFLDPPMVGAAVARECHYLARAGILRIPLLGWLCRALNAHPIRRGAGDRPAIRLCRRLLSQGGALVFFPEGTRSRDGRLGSIQSGFSMILDGMTENVPIVPVVAQDTYYSMRRGQFLPRPCKVRIIFGEPAPLPPRHEGERGRDYFDRCSRELERRLRQYGAR